MGTRRLPAAGLALAIAGLLLAGCTEVEESASVYEAAHVEEVEGTDLKSVTFTEEGVRRTGLKTAVVERRGGNPVVPYDALIYDGQGKSWVYAVPKPLTYMRAPVKVARVEGDTAVLAKGPPAQSHVVTTGASEVYGSELEIAGSH
jgi:hypothetical protein